MNNKMTFGARLCFICLGLWASNHALADGKSVDEKFFYTWSSENGTPVFSDQAPADVRASKIKKEAIKSLPPSTSSSPTASTIPNTIQNKPSIPIGLPPIPGAVLPSIKML